MRPAGFMIDVLITLSVTVRGTDEQVAVKIARDFADTLIPRKDVGMESNPEDGCMVLDELPADDTRDEP